MHRFVRFAAVGVATNAIDFGLFAVLQGGLHWPVPLSNLLSYTLAATFSFLANRHFTFGSGNGRAGTQALRFIAMNGIGLLLSTVLVSLLALAMVAWLAKLISVVVLIGYFYTVSRLFVFRD